MEVRLGVLLTGEAGSVVVASAREPERYAASVPEGAIGAPPDAVDAVDLLPCETRTRERVASWGLPVRDVRLEEGLPPDGVRVVTVSAASTGSGKTALTRRLARGLKRSGVRVVVVRHPMRPDVPVEVRATEGSGPLDEREELAPVVGTGVLVITGSDPHAMLALAATLGDVIVWDGGGAAMPWVRPDIRIVVVDLLRRLPPLAEEQVRAADAIVMTKSDTAPEARARQTEATVRTWNADAPAILADLPVACPEGQRLMDRTVVVVEDAPSLVLGGLKAGAGALAAKRFRNRVVDPRPFAVGRVAEVLEEHPHIGAVIPSVGATEAERADLAASIRATPGDAILWASPASPEPLLEGEPRPVLRVFAELMEVAGGGLQDLVRPLLPGHG